MFEKVFTNGVAVSYGPSFPTTAIADGTLFYKTVSSSGYPVGFYVFGTRPDVDTGTIGPQVGQGWFAADAGDLYLKLTGGTLTGALAVVSHVKVTQSVSPARFTFGNTSSVNPIILESQNKIFKIGLGSSFSGSGGTITPILTADLTNLNTGLAWNNNTVWHAGNDGENSGLDADKLDGSHASKSLVINTIPVRDAYGDIFVNRINFSSNDDEPVGKFVVTNGSDGYSKIVPTERAKEAIRLSTQDDGAQRKTWNINISGNAATASDVNWNNISNKPTWLTDGNITWDDISGKPTTVFKYNFNSVQRSPNPFEFTNSSVDIHSGIWFGNYVSDAPNNANTYKDPDGTDAWDYDRSNYWIGFQSFNSTNSSSGVQLIANWDTENIDTDGDGNSMEDARSFLVYRVNDDNGVANTAFNSFSPWIKIWTNTSLTSLGQLKNDPGFATTTDLSGYLKLNSSVEQQVTGQVAFKNNYFYGRKSDNTVAYFLNATNGNIECIGTITAGSHFQTTNGDIYTENGRIWADNGHIGTGTSGGRGTITLLPGYTDNGTNFTGVLRLSNANNGISFGRIMGDMTSGFMRYDVDPDNSFSMRTTAYHRFDATIKSLGDVVAYASDGRLKTNISKIENAIEKVSNLGGYTYDWDLGKCSEVGFKPTNVHEHGLIAQEVEKIIPDAVCESAIEGYLTVKYERIVPVLVAAISEADEKIKHQQTEIDILKSEMEEMREILRSLKKG